MRKYALILIGICISFNSFSQNFAWAKSMGGPRVFETGYDIVVDRSGNVYTAGIFTDTADFDPGPANYNLYSANPGIFISKLDAAGNFVWAKKISGSSNFSYPLSIALDKFDNVYIINKFSGTADFDPGPGTFYFTEPDNQPTMFIVKLNTEGDFLWAKKMEGTGNSYGTSIALDYLQNVYTTGYFNGIVDFDPGPGTYELGSMGSAGTFVSKLDSNGNFLWARNTGDSAQGLSIGVDSSANVYTVGSFEGIVDFDPGPGTYNLTSVNIHHDIFVFKLDSSGNFLWAKAIGSAGEDNGRAIAVDKAGNVYCTGVFQLTADFDPGPSVYNLVSSGYYDIFILKLTTDGNFAWARSIGSTDQDDGFDISTDMDGDVYVTGNYVGTVDFDPGPGIYNLSSAGIEDMFVLKLNGDGNFNWVRSIGNENSNQEGLAIATDTSSNVYTSGRYRGMLDFDPGPGVYNLTPVGYDDIFVLKLSPIVAPVILLNFEVGKDKASARLDWKTATESNSNKFEIERSMDARDFKKIGEVAVAGNSNTIKNYGFVDTDAGINFPNTNIYYRLKQIDLDEHFAFSPTLSVSFKQDVFVSVYPNPFSDNIIIQTDALQPGSKYFISDESGKSILDGVINNTSENISLKQLPAGIYFIKVGKNNKAIKIIKKS